MLKFIGAPLNLGYSNPHVAKAPSLFRPLLIQMLDRFQIPLQDLGDVRYSSPFQGEVRRGRITNLNLKNLSAITNFNHGLASKISLHTKNQNDFLLTIGGDHSMAIGSLAGITAGRKIGLIWIDAHCDAHTPKTTYTGWIYGMPLAIICGMGEQQLLNLGWRIPMVDPHKVCVFGTRYYEPEEITNLRQLGVTIITMDEIISQGVGKSMQKALKTISSGVDSIHVSFDLDSVDEYYAPGVSEPCHGMFTYRELTYIMSRLAQTKLCKSMDICEYDFTKDIDNQTINLAIELIAKLHGHNYSEYDQYLEDNKL